MIVIGWHSAEGAEDIAAQNPNVVFADHNPGIDGTDLVENDLARAMTRVPDALGRLAYRRIAYAGVTNRPGANREPVPEVRLDAFMRWAGREGPFDPALALSGASSEESGHDMGLRLLDLPQRPEAIVTGTDSIAVGVYRALHQMRTTYAAATIIVFMANWNNYLWPPIVLQTNGMKTITLAISSMASAHYPDFGVVMVGTIIATLRTLVVFFLLQRLFVEGMLGSIK